MSKLTESARDMSCMIRIPGVCNWNPETTVLCHLNGGGLALKKDDSEGAFGCSNCHAAVDGKTVVKHRFTHDQIELMFRQGVERTRDYWRVIGLMPKYGKKKR